MRFIWNFFFSHPDLRRLLTDYGFEGYPLRKDFPLVGFMEIRYDLFLKRITSNVINFSTEYRLYTFNNNIN